MEPLTTWAKTSNQNVYHIVSPLRRGPDRLTLCGQPLRPWCTHETREEPERVCPACREKAEG